MRRLIDGLVAAVVVPLFGWLLWSLIDGVRSSGSASIVLEWSLLFLYIHICYGCSLCLHVGFSGSYGISIVFLYPYLYAGTPLLSWEDGVGFLFFHIGFSTACFFLANSRCGLLVGCYVRPSLGGVC